MSGWKGESLRMKGLEIDSKVLLAINSCVLVIGKGKVLNTVKNEGETILSGAVATFPTVSAYSLKMLTKGVTPLPAAIINRLCGVSFGKKQNLPIGPRALRTSPVLTSSINQLLTSPFGTALTVTAKKSFWHGELDIV